MKKSEDGVVKKVIENIVALASNDQNIDALWLYGSRDNTYTQSMREHVALISSELDGLNEIISERSFSRYEYRAAERTLQVLIEACIGIAKHWSKDLIGVSPSDAYMAFQRLQENRIPVAIKTDWRPIVGMRNALVHDYLNIDQTTVEYIIRKRKYSELMEFASAGLAHLDQRKSE